VRKLLEDYLCTFLKKYGEVPRVNLLQDGPENLSIFQNKAVSISILKEAILPKKGKEHLGPLLLPRMFTLLNMYTLEVNTAIYLHGCTRCREIRHALNHTIQF
jgi:hypothetical protein